MRQHVLCSNLSISVSLLQIMLYCGQGMPGSSKVLHCSILWQLYTCQSLNDIYTGFNQQLNSVVINHLSIEVTRTCVLMNNSTLVTR